MADKAGCRCRPVAGEPSHDRPLPRNEDAKVDANFLTHLISGAPVAFGSEGEGSCDALHAVMGVFAAITTARVSDRDDL